MWGVWECGRCVCGVWGWCVCGRCVCGRWLCGRWLCGRWLCGAWECGWCGWWVCGRWAWTWYHLWPSLRWPGPSCGSKTSLSSVSTSPSGCGRAVEGLWKGVSTSSPSGPSSKSRGSSRERAVCSRSSSSSSCILRPPPSSRLPPPSGPSSSCSRRPLPAAPPGMVESHAIEPNTGAVVSTKNCGRQTWQTGG